MTRIWQYQQYTLSTDSSDSANVTGGEAGDRPSQRVDIAAAAAAIAGMKPTYVCSLVRLRYGMNLTEEMIGDFNTIRNAVLIESPSVKFDVELNLNPGKGDDSDGQKVYPDADALVRQMSDIDAILHPDGWWFDYYSAAYRRRPDLIAAINKYAKSKGQTVGGNIGGGGKGESWIVPTGADVVAFVDDSDDSTPFGYGIDESKLSATRANISAASSDTVLLGHIHCNPQDGPSSEPCVFMKDWDAPHRAAFIEYWAIQQSKLGFTAMWPMFFPLCPGSVAYDATSDFLVKGSISEGVPARDGTVYDFMRELALGEEVSGTGATTVIPQPSTATTNGATSKSVTPSPTMVGTSRSQSQAIPVETSPIQSTTRPSAAQTTDPQQTAPVASPSMPVNRGSGKIVWDHLLTLVAVLVLVLNRI